MRLILLDCHQVLSVYLPLVSMYNMILVLDYRSKDFQDYPDLYLSLYLMPQIMFVCTCAHDTVFNICLLIRFIDTRCLLVHTTWPHFMYSLGNFLTTLDLHVQILQFKACEFSMLLIRVRNRSVDYQ